MITDEQLGAFLDGELPPDEIDRIAALVEQDAALAVRLEQMAATDRLVRSAFAAPLSEPVPEALIAATRTPSVAANDNAPSARWRMMAGGALAASVAVGLALGVTLAGRMSADAPLALSASVQQALESVPSGQGAGPVQPLLTVALADGRVCRQFTLSADGSPVDGLACRESGQWRALAWAARTGGAPDGGFVTAAGPSAPIGAMLDALGAGEPVTGPAEAALLKGSTAAGE